MSPNKQKKKRRNLQIVECRAVPKFANLVELEKMLHNEYFLVKCGVDTAAHERLRVWSRLRNNIANFVVVCAGVRGNNGVCGSDAGVCGGKGVCGRDASVCGGESIAPEISSTSSSRTSRR